MKPLLVPIKRLESEYYPLRFPKSMAHKKYSAVIFDGCNFNCPFCFESNRNPDGTPRQNLGMINLTKVIDFAIQEVEKGNPIEITGGEPTLYPEAVYELIKAIKNIGGYVNLATNGSKPEIVRELAGQVDCLGLDVKSVQQKINFYTSKEKELSFSNPVKVLQESSNYGCAVHFKRIMFESTTFDEIEFFYPLARHAYWIFKQLRPFPNSSHSPANQKLLNPMPSFTLNRLVSEFVTKHPELEGRVVSIAGGSGRHSKNYTYW